MQRSTRYFIYTFILDLLGFVLIVVNKKLYFVGLTAIIISALYLILALRARKLEKEKE